MLLKVIYDSKVQVLIREETGRVRDDWNVKTINPPDLSSLSWALKLKETRKDTTVTVVHLGPEEHEIFLFEALSMGCDEAVRIWDEDIADIPLSPRIKALLLERTARILGFDLILAGSRGLDTSSGQVPLLLGFRLSRPCVVDVVEIEEVVQGKARVLKALQRGYRKRIELFLPAILGMEGMPGKSYLSWERTLQERGKRIDLLSLSDLGLTKEVIRRLHSFTGPDRLSPPRPRLRHIEAPSSDLPAFDRIQRLVKGQIRVREGKIIRGDKEEIAKSIFRFLLEEGWLGIGKGQGRENRL